MLVVATSFHQKNNIRDCTPYGTLVPSVAEICPMRWSNWECLPFAWLEKETQVVSLARCFRKEFPGRLNRFCRDVYNRRDSRLKLVWLFRNRASLDILGNIGYHGSNLSDLSRLRATVDIGNVRTLWADLTTRWRDTHLGRLGKRRGYL